WKPWSVTPQIFSPRARSSARTASMPFLSMVRRAAVETRSFTQRFSEATQKRRSCRLGRKRRRVLLLACETLLPVCTPLPVTWQTRDIRTSEGLVSPIAREPAAPPAMPRWAWPNARREGVRLQGWPGSRSRADPATPGRSAPCLMRGRVPGCHRVRPPGRPVPALVRGLVALPAAVADVQVQAVDRGEGGEQVLQHPHRVLLGREQEVAERHQAAEHAHVPEQARDHRLAGLARGQELDQPAAAEHQRAGVADQLPAGDVQAGPVEPFQRLVQQRHQSSSTRVRWLRAISQATPRRSRMPTRARPRLLYLDTPAVRARWLTGTLTVFQPARCTSAGR